MELTIVERQQTIVIHWFHYSYTYQNTPLEFFFQEQSYSSLHSLRSLAWDHVRGDTDDSCGAIADLCLVIADPCGVVVIPEAIGGCAVADAATTIVARLTEHHKRLLNIVKHHETHVKHCEPLAKYHETLKTLLNIMEHSSFDAEMSALDVETSAFGAATSAIMRRSFDATISALDAETSALGPVARSYQRYRRGVSGDCGVGITPQMCNRITNQSFRYEYFFQTCQGADSETCLKLSVRQDLYHTLVKSCYLSYA